jgi:hypothetical protein
MDNRIQDAYFEYCLEQVRAGIIDDSLTEGPDDGRSMDQRIVDILRSAGRLPEGWDQDEPEPARQSA